MNTSRCVRAFSQHLTVISISADVKEWILFCHFTCSLSSLCFDETEAYSNGTHNAIGKTISQSLANLRIKAVRNQMAWPSVKESRSLRVLLNCYVRPLCNVASGNGSFPLRYRRDLVIARITRSPAVISGLDLSRGEAVAVKMHMSMKQMDTKKHFLSYNEILCSEWIETSWNVSALKSSVL